MIDSLALDCIIAYGTNMLFNRKRKATTTQLGDTVNFLFKAHGPHKTSPELNSRGFNFCTGQS